MTLCVSCALRDAGNLIISHVGVLVVFGISLMRGVVMVWAFSHRVVDLVIAHPSN